jgi:hypothetical protein
MDFKSSVTKILDLITSGSVSHNFGGKLFMFYTKLKPSRGIFVYYYSFMDERLKLLAYNAYLI